MRSGGLKEKFRRSAARVAAYGQSSGDSGGGNPLAAIGNAVDSAQQDQFRTSIEQLRHFRDWVFTAIRPIAQRIAGQSVRVARFNAAQATRSLHHSKHASPAKLLRAARMPERTKELVDNLEMLDWHPFIEALNNPNPVMVCWQLLYVWVVALKLTGKAYWWMPLVEGRRQIWPVPPSWLTPLHVDGVFFAKWKLQIPGATGEAELPGDEVAYFHMPDPTSPLGAFSELQAIAKAVVSDDLLQTSQMNGLKNGMTPGLAFVIGDVTAEGLEGQGKKPLLDKDQRQVLINAVKRMASGVMRAGEPVILDALVRDVKRISATNAEMDFLNSGKATKDRVQQGMGSNSIVSGGTTGSTKAEAVVAESNFYNQTCNPLIELLSQLLTSMVAPKFALEGEQLVIWIETCRVRDDEQQLAELKFAASAGAVSRNQIATALGFPPLADGDNIYMPAMSVLVPVLPEGSSAKSPRRLLSKAAYKALWSRAHGDNESALAAALRSFFAEQRKSVESSLRDLFGKDPRRSAARRSKESAHDLLAHFFDEDRWNEKLQAAASPSMLRSAVYGASIQLSRFQKAPDDDGDSVLLDVPDGVLADIRTSLDESFQQPYWKKIQAHTRDALSTGLASAIDSGGGLEAMVDAVDDALGPDTSDARSKNIARTETTMAINAGAYESRRDLARRGLITMEQWLGIGDDKERETHFELNDTTKKPDEMWNVGGYDAPYPGHWSLPAEERCGCRCQSIASESFADDE